MLYEDVTTPVRAEQVGENDAYHVDPALAESRREFPCHLFTDHVELPFRHSVSLGAEGITLRSKRYRPVRGAKTTIGLTGCSGLIVHHGATVRNWTGDVRHEIMHDVGS